MSRHLLRRAIDVSRARWRMLAEDGRGIAAVEFGLIAPVLLIMLIGVIEITRAVSIDRRFGQVTSMVADLIAREENITAADVQAIYGIVEHVMGVWGTDTLKLQVIPVKANEANPPLLHVYAETANRPSYGAGAAAPKPMCEQYTGLSNNLLAQGGLAIVVESEFRYTPLLVGGMLSAQTWHDKAVLAPRQTCVDFDGNECNPMPACDVR